MSDGWWLRRAGAGDAAALALVAGASFLETFAGHLAGADIVAHLAKHSAPASFAAWAQDGASVIILAEHAHGAAPLGYSVLTTPDLPIATGPADIELRRIYTLAQMHGSGLGAALMARAIGDAKASGATRLLLGVWGGNARAQAFYVRQGFVLAGERRYRVGDTLHDDFVYARMI